MSSLYAKITKDFTTTSKGLGSNGFLSIIITAENGRQNIAEINILDDKQNGQILTTFIPLGCQEFVKKTPKSKALAIENTTRRYCTAYENGKVKSKSLKGE